MREENDFMAQRFMLVLCADKFIAGLAIEEFWSSIVLTPAGDRRQRLVAQFHQADRLFQARFGVSWIPF